MQVLYERCCGLDVHKRTVVACPIVTRPTEPGLKTIWTFGTMTEDLLTLGDWLTEACITSTSAWAEQGSIFLPLQADQIW